jgi:7-cyano-7-deazaguanine reductase
VNVDDNDKMVYLRTPGGTLPEFEALGQQGSPDLGGNLETFPKPDGLVQVTLQSDEVTAVCPVTGQPDFYTVTISTVGAEKCIESKSLKLYLGRFRQEGIFCEAFAAHIAHDVYEVTKAPAVTVEIRQKPRGGISIVAVARLAFGRQPQVQV